MCVNYVASVQLISRVESGLQYLIFRFLYEAKPTLPANFEEDTWAKLKSAICAIFLKQPNSCDLEKLYQVKFIILVFFSLSPLI